MALTFFFFLDEEAADGHQQNTAASANWKDFLAGLRTGHYEMSDTFRHHMDPDTPLFLPDDHGKSDNESDSSSEKATKPSKRSKVVEAKEALNRGQEHVNTKGKLIRARRMGDGCGKKSCRWVHHIIFESTLASLHHPLCYHN